MSFSDTRQSLPAPFAVTSLPWIPCSIPDFSSILKQRFPDWKRPYDASESFNLRETGINIRQVIRCLMILSFRSTYPGI